MNPFYKNLALWMVIGLIVILLFNLFQANPSALGEFLAAPAVPDPASPA